MKLKKAVRMSTNGELHRFDKFKARDPELDSRPLYNDGNFLVFPIEERRPYILK